MTTVVCWGSLVRHCPARVQKNRLKLVLGTDVYWSMTPFTNSCGSGGRNAIPVTHQFSVEIPVAIR